MNEASLDDAFGSHFSDELANKGILVAAEGTTQGEIRREKIRGKRIYIESIIIVQKFISKI